ncbi:MAG: NADH-quinone oxidoreductase subunit J [Opitutaceae bacterium]|nr:NADH-quinone oxidoreductase subunit J [Cytophagales bacterium]
MILYNMMTVVVFAFFAGITVFSALAITFQKNLMYSAFYLLVTFLGIACLYILLEADFLAVTQILIYVGGILTLILFGVLITQRRENRALISGIIYRKRSAFISITLGAILCYVIWNERYRFHENNKLQSSVHTLGYGLMGNYLLPFELAGVLILVILIGVLSLSSSIKPQ